MKTVRVMKIVSHDESQLRSLDELLQLNKNGGTLHFFRCTY